MLLEALKGGGRIEFEGLVFLNFIFLKKNLEKKYFGRVKFFLEDWCYPSPK